MPPPSFGQAHKPVPRTEQSVTDPDSTQETPWVQDASTDQPRRPAPWGGADAQPWDPAERFPTEYDWFGGSDLPDEDGRRGSPSELPRPGRAPWPPTTPGERSPERSIPADHQSDIPAPVGPGGLGGFGDAESSEGPKGVEPRTGPVMDPWPGQSPPIVPGAVSWQPPSAYTTPAAPAHNTATDPAHNPPAAPAHNPPADSTYGHPVETGVWPAPVALPQEAPPAEPLIPPTSWFPPPVNSPAIPQDAPPSPQDAPWEPQPPQGATPEVTPAEPGRTANFVARDIPVWPPFPPPGEQGKHGQTAPESGGGLLPGEATIPGNRIPAGLAPYTPATDASGSDSPRADALGTPASRTDGPAPETPSMTDTPSADPLGTGT
ncbi:hypothetical protein AB0O34_17520, partial [Sphaerisporangium sp. NPDC088356]